MRNFILFSTFIITSYLVFGQNYNLKQAVKHYESKNLGLAEKEIEQAATSSFASEHELAKVMNYYFLIKADIYDSEEALSSNMEVIHLMAKAYRSCAKNDRKEEYLPLLKEKAERLISFIDKIGEKQYASKNYLEYFRTMEYYASIKGLISNEAGTIYAKLSEEAYAHGKDLLGIKYNFEMIALGYEEEKAYKQSIDALYRLGNIKKVDQLIAQARKNHPSSYSFAKTEIQRMIDEDMIYTALEYSKEVLSKTENNVDVLFLHGRINDLLNEHEKALTSYEKVLEVDSNHFETNLALGIYYYKFSNREGHISQAASYLKTANQLNPTDNQAIIYLNEVLALQQKDTVLLTTNH